MELVIKCQHEQDSTTLADPLPTVYDYHPLTKHELWALLNLASVATGILVSTIQVRLTKGIRGITCPHPIEGEVSKRMNRLDKLYIETYHDDPCRLPDLVKEFWQIMEGE